MRRKLDEGQRTFLNNIKKAWPELSEIEKVRLLGFGEGLSFKVDYVREQREAASNQKEA